MAKKRKEMNAHEASLLAKIYYQEGLQIITQSAQKSTQIHELICRNIVGCTNLAFACEVALKVLITSYNGSVSELPNGHYLDVLYKQLCSELQVAIKYVTVVKYNKSLINSVYTEEMFESDLHKFSKAFEQSRYWYERDESEPTKEAGILFISSLAKALIFLITKVEEAIAIQNNQVPE